MKDMLVPIADLKGSIELFHSEVEIYPIWLCPFKLPPNEGMLKTRSKTDEMFVDVGVYGVPKNDRQSQKNFFEIHINIILGLMLF